MHLPTRLLVALALTFFTVLATDDADIVFPGTGGYKLSGNYLINKNLQKTHVGDGEWFQDKQSALRDASIASDHSGGNSRPRFLPPSVFSSPSNALPERLTAADFSKRLTAADLTMPNAPDYHRQKKLSTTSSHQSIQKPKFKPPGFMHDDIDIMGGKPWPRYLSRPGSISTSRPSSFIALPLSDDEILPDDSISRRGSTSSATSIKKTKRRQPNRKKHNRRNSSNFSLKFKDIKQDLKNHGQIITAEDNELFEQSVEEDKDKRKSYLARKFKSLSRALKFKPKSK